MASAQSNLEAIDAKLLILFEELLSSRSVTRTAERLGLAQPTVSMGLKRLRAVFDDQLFVHTAQGMKPTPRANALAEPIGEALRLLREALGTPREFDPATSHRSFRVCMTDSSHIVFLPRLLAHVRQAAPNVTLEILNITSETPELLRADKADIAIGFVPILTAGFFQQTLFSQGFVCLASATHPRIRGTLSVKEFEAERHIVVVLSGTGHAIADKVIETRNIKRQVAVRMPGFPGLSPALADSDLLATVPAQIGKALGADGRLQVLKCPFPVPSYKVKQHWHALQHQDAGNQWMRGVLYQLFAEK
jgi:DNA-binding transcriptional LysR family regulator